MKHSKGIMDLSKFISRSDDEDEGAERKDVEEEEHIYDEVTPEHRMPPDGKDVEMRDDNSDKENSKSEFKKMALRRQSADDEELSEWSDEEPLLPSNKNKISLDFDDVDDANQENKGDIKSKLEGILQQGPPMPNWAKRQEHESAKVEVHQQQDGNGSPAVSEQEIVEDDLKSEDSEWSDPESLPGVEAATAAVVPSASQKQPKQVEESEGEASKPKIAPKPKPVPKQKEKEKEKGGSPKGNKDKKEKVVPMVTAPDEKEKQPGGNNTDSMKYLTPKPKDMKKEKKEETTKITRNESSSSSSRRRKKRRSSRSNRSMSSALTKEREKQDDESSSSSSSEEEHAVQDAENSAIKRSEQRESGTLKKRRKSQLVHQEQTIDQSPPRSTSSNRKSPKLDMFKEMFLTKLDQADQEEEMAKSQVDSPDRRNEKVAESSKMDPDSSAIAPAPTSEMLPDEVMGKTKKNK